MHTKSSKGWHGLHAVLLIFASTFSAQLWAQNCTEMCNWYNIMEAPLCENQDDGFGWEGHTCIGRNMCESQYSGSGVFLQCEGISDEELCNTINGRSYYSDALFEMGLSPTGEYKGHRFVSFEDGLLQASQSDYIISAPYRCEQGQVIADVPGMTNYLIDFSQHLSTMNFDIDATDPVPYTLASTDNANCSQVRDGRYVVDPAELANVTLPAGTSYEMLFSGDHAAQINIPAGRYDNAFYDCTTGALHVHRTTSDSNPIPVTIENSGDVVVAQLDANTNWRFLRDDGQACTTQYDPVCSIEPIEVACFAEPCPVGVYRTYSNQCNSDAAGAMFISQGECGDLEGEPYYDPGVCTTEYDPVCAVETRNIVCITGPCPNEFYKTYGNACEAQVDRAPILFRGECGEEREDAPYWGHTEACGAEAPYEPLCAARSFTAPCLTTPCPIEVFAIYSNECEMDNAGSRFVHTEHCGAKTDSRVRDLSEWGGICGDIYLPVCGKDEVVPGVAGEYIYKSFGNACEARRSVVDLTWDDQACGALAGVSAGAEPPVKIVNNLSSSNKIVGLSNASITGDVLTVDLSYSGCSEQHFNFEVMRSFAETQPVQARVRFIPLVEDDCDAALSFTYKYDLLPLKATYEAMYGSGPATIVLPGLGDYEINGGTAPATLDISHPDTGVVGELITIEVHSSAATPGRPNVEILDPNGNPVESSWSSTLPSDGPPWVYDAQYPFTPEIPGEYRVNVSFEPAPELNQSSIISVAQIPLSECAAAGVDAGTVNAYPNWTARDWAGGAYNHANSGDLMSYQGKVYRANWYTSSVPGSDNSWSFVCNL